MRIPVRRSAFLYTDYGEPRLVLPGIAVVAAAFLLTLAPVAGLRHPPTPEERAQALLHSGKVAEAERAYRDLLEKSPSAKLVLAFLDAHRYAKVFQLKLDKNDSRNDSVEKSLPIGKSLTEEEVDQVIEALPPDVRTIGRFARDFDPSPEVLEDLGAGAKREPPMPYANELLARLAMHQDKLPEAADFYEKEGIWFEERRGDVDESLRIRMHLDDWEGARARLADPRVAAAASPHPKYELAVHDRDWKTAARWLPVLWAPRLVGSGLVLSAMTALGWFFFCARLGKLGERPKFRLPMYLLAFALGVCSVAPTVLLIAVEEAKLHLHETGDPARDILFFVFGVGLREEASKLLMFLPLLPLLRRWGDKLDVLVCGAMVGLGFAAEENLGYLADGNLHNGLGRFLTANFFHMAMTGTLASALDDFLRDREKFAADFSRTSVFIVGIHGAYDFLLSHDEYGGTYLAMTAFVFLTRMFLNAVEVARRRADRGLTPLHAFVFAVSLVVGVTLAYATLAVGPKLALGMMGAGLIGEGIIVYVFVRTLRTI